LHPLLAFIRFASLTGANAAVIRDVFRRFEKHNRFPNLHVRGLHNRKPPYGEFAKPHLTVDDDVALAVLARMQRAQAGPKA